MPFENPIESYTREQAMGAPDIEMGIPVAKKPIVVIPTVKPEKEDSNTVIKDLESQRIQVVQKVLTIPSNEASNILLDFMSNGAKDFEKRTGRPMTYSEIRAAWG